MEKPNIILVTVDSLRADHLNPYGYKKNTSPFLEKFSKDSWTFLQSYSTGPNTHPSFPAILTSTYPSLFPRGETSGYLEKERTVISEILKMRGYATSAFHSNPFLSKYFGYDRGFDRFEDFMITERASKEKSRKKPLFKKMQRFWDLAVLKKPPFARAKQVNGEFEKWATDAKEPFFSWVHYMDVHMPYLPPRGYLPKVGEREISHISQLRLANRMTNPKTRTKFSEKEVGKSISLYDASIRYADDCFKRLVEFVENRPERDSIIIFTSDHGEEFMEHGSMGHTQKFYQELIRVPLFVKGPNTRGKKISARVSLIDLPVLILELVGQDVPDSFQGRSILGRMYSGGDAPVFAETNTKKGVYGAIIDDKYKLISTEKKELYDLETDPGEKTNLIQQEPDVAKDLNEKLERHFEDNLVHKKKLEAQGKVGQIRDVAKKIKL